MDNANLAQPSGPSGPASNAITIDGSGARTDANDSTTAIAQKIERASNAAVDAHLSDPAIARKRGRGPDKKPRRPRVPVGDLANGAGEPSLEGISAEPLAFSVPTVPAFDEETARALVDIAIGLLNDGAAGIVRAIAKKETGDDTLSAEAAGAVRMSEKVEAAIKTGAIQCAKKYAVRLDYAPEMMLGGGLLIWLGQVSLSVKALKARGAALRQAAG